MAEHQRKLKRIKCPVCRKRFGQRPDGRPKTCSRTCARKKDWETRPSINRYVNNKGYVLVAAPSDYVGKVYLLGKKSRTPLVLEHRLVMSRKLGRPLKDTETVHHKNGRRDDNREKNLELHIGAHGPGATHAHCETCTCFE